MIKRLMILCAFVAPSLMANAQLKVAHINTSVLLDSLPEAQKIQNELEEYQNSLIDYLAKKEQKIKKIQAEMGQPGIAESMKEIYQEDLQNEIASYQEFQQSLQQKIAKKQQDLLNPLITKIKDVITAVAKENGYHYVVDTTEGGGIIFADESFDLLELVLKKIL